MWNLVQELLLAFKQGKIKLSELDDLTVDTLYGSMWGLNIRYTTLSEALNRSKNEIITYSLQRISKLVGEAPFTFKTQQIPRCRIGYGTFGWKYDPKIIELAIENASIIDTAEGYGYGKVETELGKIFSWSDPAEVNTKVRRDHMSPTAIINSVTRSVDKLNCIPYVQLHFPNDKFPYAVKDLADLRKKGLIKSIGLSNCSIDMIEYAQLLLSTYSGDVISSVQLPFNLVDNRISKSLIPYCQERGIVVMAYSPLGQKFERLQTPLLSGIAKRNNCTKAQVALSWLLSFEGILPIPTTNNIQHLKENFESNDLYLDEEDIIELTDYYDERI